MLQRPDRATGAGAGRKARPIMRVLVLGGRGFIGRHVVAALLARGHQVEIGGRRARVAGELPVHELALHRRVQPADWQDALRAVDAVVNCVGILRERWAQTYARVHCDAPAALAAACAARGVRLVHVSALGLSADARSRFIRSKWAGEQAIRAANEHAIVVRPSLLDGEGGFGARWIRRVAQWPVQPLPGAARGQIAALQVSELGEVIAALVAAPAADCPREVELGGPEAMPMGKLLLRLRAHGRAAPLQIALPCWMARIGSHVCDLLHFSPFSFGHLELMSRANVPAVNAAAHWLGRAPAALGAAPAPPAIVSPALKAAR
ncbi:NAD-dependent epimerase/dehydratase family protein [Piscinibacterium candidicorallinum]|uniref:NAD-dependent epimerase/dehydratase family protein n=2 Tax=Piscinibacterium candidicorallinum TaxID=1793872 RepID=A0ABV7H7Z0_9BURK